MLRGLETPIAESGIGGRDRRFRVAGRCVLAAVSIAMTCLIPWLLVFQEVRAGVTRGRAGESPSAIGPDRTFEMRYVVRGTIYTARADALLPDGVRLRVDDDGTVGSTLRIFVNDRFPVWWEWVDLNPRASTSKRCSG